MAKTCCFKENKRQVYNYMETGVYFKGTKNA